MNAAEAAPPAREKAVFLDRDGVLNHEIGHYVWHLDEFVIAEGVPESLARLKAAGYHLIVVTNQAGIAKGLYTAREVHACHQKLQQACNHAIDAFYFASGHPSVSESLMRKPDSLMLEKALARFRIDPSQSWIIGDRLRDLAAGAKVGVRGILVGEGEEPRPALYARDLRAATELILGC